MINASTKLCKMCDHRQYDYDCLHRATGEIARCQASSTGLVVMELGHLILVQRMEIALNVIIQHHHRHNVRQTGIFSCLGCILSN